MAQLEAASLARLRQLVEAAQAERSSLIAPDVLELAAALGLPGRVVIDLTALEHLGHPWWSSSRMARRYQRSSA